MAVWGGIRPKRGRELLGEQERVKNSSANQTCGVSNHVGQ